MSDHWPWKEMKDAQVGDTFNFTANLYGREIEQRFEIMEYHSTRKLLADSATVEVTFDMADGPKLTDTAKLPLDAESYYEYTGYKMEKLVDKAGIERPTKVGILDRLYNRIFG